MPDLKQYYAQGLDLWNGRIYPNDLAGEIIEESPDDFGEYIGGRYAEDKKTIEKCIGYKFISESIVRWDKERKYFFFTDLQFPELGLDKGKIRIDINPCLHGTSTKVFVIPMRGLKEQEFKKCKSIFAEFYTNSEKASKIIMECVSDRYFSYLNEWTKQKDKKLKSNEEKNHYNLYCHIKSLCGDVNAETELVEVIENIMQGKPVVPQQAYNLLETQINLNELIGKKWDFADYEIFAQVSQKTEFAARYNAPSGLFGFAGNDYIGHLAGLTTCYPHKLTIDIILDIVNTI